MQYQSPIPGEFIDSEVTLLTCKTNWSFHRGSFQSSSLILSWFAHSSFLYFHNIVNFFVTKIKCIIWIVTTREEERPDDIVEKDGDQPYDESAKSVQNLQMI